MDYTKLLVAQFAWLTEQGNEKLCKELAAALQTQPEGLYVSAPPTTEEARLEALESQARRIVRANRRPLGHYGKRGQKQKTSRRFRTVPSRHSIRTWEVDAI